MPTPRIIVLRAPGSNCDQEAAFAFETAGGKAEIVHLNRALENPKILAAANILCIPGGFSYGDDMSAGRVFGNQIRHHLAGALQDFKATGKLILGICNGFQILIKSGVLLPDRADEPIATLTNNDSGTFECRWINLAVEGGKCVFLQGIHRLYVPIAHAEGKFVARDEATLNSLERKGQLCLRYCEPTAESGKRKAEGSSPSPQPPAPSPLLPYPTNPNGAQRNPAGVCDETGRVLGLMPHPERHIDPTQHPRWTREKHERGDGLAVFENAVRYFG
ncbi:MAG: phosphoribosylformylglycinamidine synthase subunit PurQ [Pirellulaceae bacterium]